jgi:hypothetical protein
VVPIVLRYPSAVSNSRSQLYLSIDQTIGLDDKFKLFCWIIDKSDNPFSINIAQSETVGDLKQKIKNLNQRELNYLASDSLTLFKVSNSYPKRGLRSSLAADTPLAVK